MLPVRYKKSGLKFLKVSGISVAGLLLILLLLPILFPNAIAEKIKGWTNNTISGELNFSKARLSFFNHFPALTLTLYDITLKGSPPFENDTLVAVEQIALGINLSSLFKSAVNIQEIYVSNGFIHVQVNKEGHPNYNIYTSGATDATTGPVESSGTALKIDLIAISGCTVRYEDQSLPMQIHATDLNYKGKGDLTQSLFDLHSFIKIESLDLTYNGIPYILKKRINGNLITKINTESLNLVFEKNDLKINELPLRFRGSLGFLKNGYELDFRVGSKESNLGNILSTLPPEYARWLEETQIDGFADVYATFKGQYIVETNSMPDVALYMKIRNGSIKHQKASRPISNLFFSLQSKLPRLNPDSFYLNIDTLKFNLDKDYFTTNLRIKGLNRPDIRMHLNTDLDVESWNKAVGSEAIELKGRLKAVFNADGVYATKVVYKGIRAVADTVITSIPRFDLTSSLSDGYLKFSGLPHAIEAIRFKIAGDCPDHNIGNMRFELEDLHAKILESFLKGKISFKNARELMLAGNIHANINLATLKDAIPLDSLDLAGNLSVDLVTKGSFLPEKKQFPVTTASLKLDGGHLQTRYYPNPIENIQVNTEITHTGTMSSIAILINPISFVFEGQPFEVKATLTHPMDIQYAIAAKGVLDIGNIAKVIAPKAYRLQGKIHADFSLKGSQAAAVNGNLQQLHNNGTLSVEDISFSTEEYPHPFYIYRGDFQFNQDKFLFKSFKGSYGNTQFTMEGYLNNAIGYALQQQKSVQGQFNFKSKAVFADELMVFAAGASTDVNARENNGAIATNNTNTAGASASTGVFVVPDNLGVTITAAIKKLHFSGIELKEFKGTLAIDSSKIKMRSTGFNIIDAPVGMEAMYWNQGLHTAFFDFSIDAREFDIKRAYNEITLFREMASAASKASGLVGLQYQLSGRLDQNMTPVYPSLKGAGTLQLKKIKLMGFKLFNSLSKSTGKDGLKDPDLSQVEVLSSIKNNIFTIPLTKMQIAGFRPRFEGQISLDGKLNLKGRLGLPPLGIIGIPFNVTGTQEAPDVKLKRGKNNELLEEMDGEDEATTPPLLP